MLRTTPEDPEQDLDVEVERSTEHSAPQEVVLTLRPAELPRLRITENGVTTYRAVSLVTLLSLLDHSATVRTLESPHVRTLSVPLPPERTMLADAVEYPDEMLFLVTGYLPRSERAFMLQKGPRSAEGEVQSSVHRLHLPALVYTALWSQHTHTVRALNIALAPVGHATAEPETPLYRYPFSNVYPGGGVCWPTMDPVQARLSEIPEKVVGGFLAVPNNSDLYGVGSSQNSPYRDYREFLQAVEEVGLLQEWLIPLRSTPGQMHRDTLARHAS